MKHCNFTENEIKEFISNLDFPVKYIINGAGNIEFCPADTNGNPVNDGKVWFKFVRSEKRDGGHYDRFWKCAHKSSPWQLFRDSRTSDHMDFCDDMAAAAHRMNRYVDQNGLDKILKSNAYCSWVYNEPFACKC